MSIILDALHKIQKNNNEYVEFSHSEMENFKALEQSRREEKNNTLKIIGGFALIFALVFNFFLFSDQESETPILDSQKNFITPEELSTQFDSAQTTVETLTEKNVEENLTDTSNQATFIDSSPIAPADIEENVPQESLVTETTVPPIESELTESKAITVEPSPPLDSVSEEKETSSTEISDNTIEEAIPSINLDPMPAWITEGQKAFQRGSFNHALKNWETGFHSLSNNTQLYSIMINYQPDLARDMLYKLIVNKLPAFTIPAAFKGKKAYYTLILPQQNAMETSKAAIIHHTNIKPFTLSKEEVLRRIALLPKPQKKVSKKIVKKNKVIKKINLKEVISKAEKDVLNGNYQKAIKQLKPHLKQNKDNWNLLFWLGSAQLGLGNLTQADKLFIQSQAINPNLPQVWTQRALIAQEMNDHTAALDHLFKAQDLAPKTPEIILNIAYSYEALGDRNGAAYSYKEFLSLTENNPNYEDLRQSARIRLNDLIYQ